MYKFAQVISIFIIALSITSCDPEKDATDAGAMLPAKMTVAINTKWGADNFEMEEVYYDSYGNRFRLDNFMTYMSMLTLIREDGTEVLLKDFHLQDFKDETTLTFEVTPGVYTGIKFGLGVPDAYNMHMDPAQYPNSHPLSVGGSQGMFWTWNTGYIFSKFEGKADTTGIEGTTLLHNYSFHTGDLGSYVEFSSLSENFNLQANTTTGITLNFHVDDIIGSGSEGIDLSQEFFAAGATPLGLKFVDRFVNSITVD